MAHPDLVSYSLGITPAAKTYFPAGFRHGTFLRMPMNDGFGIGEHAPLLCLKTHQDYDLRRYLESYARFHHQIKQNSRENFTGLYVKLSALVSEPEIDLALTCAKAHVAFGYQSLKIKIFAGHIEREIEKIKRLSTLLGPGTSLRLDANQKLNFQEASLLIKNLAHINVEYFEEPVADAEAMDFLAQEYDINLAVDESFLETMDFQKLPKKVRYLVLKPSCFKDIASLAMTVRQAKEIGLTPILSTCFESDFSAALFALLVYDLDLRDHAHGIFDPHFFSHSVLDQPLRVQNGCLALPDVFDSLSSFDLKDQPWLVRLGR